MNNSTRNLKIAIRYDNNINNGTHDFFEIQFQTRENGNLNLIIYYQCFYLIL